MINVLFGVAGVGRGLVVFNIEKAVLFCILGFVFFFVWGCVDIVFFW